MLDSTSPLKSLALKYACMQHEAAHLAQADPEKMRQHILHTLCRCLPKCIVTTSLVEDCQHSLHGRSTADDPMHTGAIHAFAGRYLLAAKDASTPLLQRLHRSALRLLPEDRAASRDDLRLVTLDALYEPGLLPPGEHTAFVRHRLGLRDGAPLSSEEIAIRMHKSLVYIHELESAVLTILTSYHAGGRHA